uniref:Post-GPI attachment to proteins factor 3 n=1 Tax=Brassica oleracea var. oleracea TaxID=109376 RepID=A0A0D3BZF2_BRAOL
MIVSHHTAGNYMKSKKANKKFDFKVFTETGPKTSLITDVTQQNDSELKNKGGKPTVRVSNVGHALHVWLNGEYHGNGHGSHDEKSPWSLSGPCFCYFFCAKPSDAFPWLFSTLSNHLHITFIIHNLSLWFLRDVDITKRLDYSSAIVVLGFSLIVSILRTFDIRVEAARVMVSTPVLALVTTHVLYINFYKFDYGWNMIVCVAMGVAQIFLWGRWAAVSRHPSNWKMWVVVIASGYLVAHSIWHLATVPLTILWWSFIRDYAKFRTSSLLKKSKTKAK